MSTVTLDAIKAKQTEPVNAMLVEALETCGQIDRQWQYFDADKVRLALTAAKQAQPERAPLSDAEITQLMNDWGVVTTKHRTDNGEPFQSVELSFARLSALLHAAHGSKQGEQHE